MKWFVDNIRILAALVLALLLPGLSACVADDSPCPDDSPRNPFLIKFQIMSAADSGTRAADLDGELEGAGYENYLNVDDIRYLIFDSDRKFVADISTKATTVNSNPEFTLYDVVAEVDAPYFKEHINTTLDFYILALANYSGWGITIPTLAEGDDMEALFTNGLVATVIPDSGKLRLAVQAEADKQYFPMAGLQRFTFAGNMLETSWEELPYDISAGTGKTLNLLRALAKIEVIDKINVADGAEFDAEAERPIKIGSATLNGFVSRGRLLPAMAQWDRNATFETQQVAAPSIPGQTTAEFYSLPPSLNADNSIAPADGLTGYTMALTYDAAATAKREDKCPVYSCYVFEYSKTGIAATQQTYLTVDIPEYIDPNTGTTIVEAATYPLRIAQYTNGYATSANNLDVLMRNHIYRFEITGISTTLRVRWTVCQMDKASAEIEYN